MIKQTMGVWSVGSNFCSPYEINVELHKLVQKVCAERRGERSGVNITFNSCLS